MNIWLLTNNSYDDEHDFSDGHKIDTVDIEKRTVLITKSNCICSGELPRWIKINIS